MKSELSKTDKVFLACTGGVTLLTVFSISLKQARFKLKMTDKKILAGMRDVMLFSPRASGMGPATEQAKAPLKMTVSSADVWGSALNNKLRGDDPPLIHNISGVFISGT